MNSKKETSSSTQRRSTTAKKSAGFTPEEHAAMKERMQEMKKGDQDGQADVLAKIDGMSEPDRSMAARLHALIQANAAELTPRLWYGMPAYARDGKVLCFFQEARKFKTRYATLGFSDQARLDEGNMWATTFALKQLTSMEEARILALLKQAMG